MEIKPEDWSEWSVSALSAEEHEYREMSNFGCGMLWDIPKGEADPTEDIREAFKIIRSAHLALGDESYVKDCIEPAERRYLAAAAIADPAERATKLHEAEQQFQRALGLTADSVSGPDAST